LALLRDLLRGDAPALIVLLTIRSDSYGQLQEEQTLDAIAKIPFDLSPMPKGSYADVIRGPAQRLAGTKRAIKIEDTLPDALLKDIEAGGAKDALPLLAFTMERLYVEHGGDGDLTVAEYRSLGGIKGSIEAAVECAFKEADKDPAVPKDRLARLALLRRGLTPWLAGIDPDTGAPLRRVARKSEIPEESRALIDHLVEQRLLATDISKETGEQTIEPVHEALLRQWGLLQGWLAEDAGLLGVLEGVKRASRDWGANGKNFAWLTHATDRLVAAERLRERADLAANLAPEDREYLEQCRERERLERQQTHRLRRRTRQTAALAAVLSLGIGAVFAWLNQAYLKARAVTLVEAIWSPVLTPEHERALKPGDRFMECADCPDMIVVRAGHFLMGSPNDGKKHYPNEFPQHMVTIARPFAVARYEVTSDEWDACVALGGCTWAAPDTGGGRGRLPVMNVSWNDAHQYVVWLSRRTGKPYRLLSEAEWEYAARAGTQTLYFWGDDIGENHANCAGCGSIWDAKQTAPVGSFDANAFGLYDMHGNVWEWVEDCYYTNYDDAPPDGLPWTAGTDCGRGRVVRGGSWNYGPDALHSAHREERSPDNRDNLPLNFRVGRTLLPP
jgi:formylglycine-generating enzyme required for sulfatase activity